MLLPENYLPNTLENYIYKLSRPIHTIYITLVLMVLVCLCLLPIIEVDITCQEQGIVRPITEKAEVIVPTAEQVSEVLVHEGQKVEKGQVLIRLRSRIPQDQLDYRKSHLATIQAQLHDLSELAKGKVPSLFLSLDRKQEYELFQLQVAEQHEQIEKTLKEYNRYKILYDKGLVAESEYEKYYYELSNKQKSLAVFKNNQLSQWASALITYSNQEIEEQSYLQQTIASKELYEVCSPVTGILDQFVGIYVGANLQAGRTIAIVSPDSALYIETYVSPRNIGYIYTGQPVRVQVSSFNYNQWGMLDGIVTEISSDYFSDSAGNMYYKVKCKPSRDYLTFKNSSRKGMLRKGMSVVSHFTLTRQSLFHLMYQSMDDWMNPNQYKM